MKKQILFAAAVLFSAGMIFITGCKKDDTTGPVITLAGSAAENSILNATWIDAGATAEDDEDGPVEVTPSGTVNKDLAGVYTITYTAVDAAGNESSVDRVVTVYNEAAAYFNGTYTASETDALGLYNYNPAKPFTCTASATVNNRVVMNRLGDFDNNAVYMTVTGSTLTIPSQTVPNVGSGTATCDVHDRQTDGSGSKTSNGFTLTYNDSKVTPCSGTRTNVVANFIKQ